MKDVPMKPLNRKQAKTSAEILAKAAGVLGSQQGA